MAQQVLETGESKQEDGNIAGAQTNGGEYLRKEVSQKSIAANRRNALRSTGPRTLKGKKKVRWNAVKHGLLARSVVITSGEGEENAGEFCNLLNHLRRDLHPFGILEEILLVEKIAVCYWRLWRVIRSESGEIRGDLGSVTEKIYLPKAFKFQRAKQLQSPLPASDLTSNSYGLEFLLGLLRKFKEEADGTGYLSEKSLEEMTQYFGHSEEGLATRCSALNPSAPDGENSAGSGDEVDPTKNSRKGILKILNEERKKLEDRCSFTREEEFQQLESERARLSLPNAAATDKILRYEIAIERQLYRAMNQLERLQRQRSGEALPPPVNIDVTTEK